LTNSFLFFSFIVVQFYLCPFSDSFSVSEKTFSAGLLTGRMCLLKNRKGIFFLLIYALLLNKSQPAMA